MVHTNDKPKCHWCGKPCKPIYRVVCLDCGHKGYQHPMSQAEKASCDGGRCPCRNVHVYFGNDGQANWNRFQKQLVGFGLQEKGLFCTQTCAVWWALKYAEKLKASQT